LTLAAALDVTNVTSSCTVNLATLIVLLKYVLRALALVTVTGIFFTKVQVLKLCQFE
jgi:hypothetical protein